MVQSAIKTLIELCTRRPWWVIAVSVLLAAGASVYSVRHFAINTDVTRLISPDLPWRQRELTFNATFPQGKETIIAVIDAPTSEAASKAAQSLTAALSGRKNLFSSVEAACETQFFAHEALLFLPADQVAATMGQLQQSAPLIRVLAGDPSLRGLTQALSFGLLSAQQNGAAGLAPLAVTLNRGIGHARRDPFRQARLFFLARACFRQAAGRERPAALRRNPPGARLRRARAGQDGKRRDPPKRHRPETQ